MARSLDVSTTKFAVSKKITQLPSQKGLSLIARPENLGVITKGIDSYAQQVLDRVEMIYLVA